MLYKKYITLAPPSTAINYNFKERYQSVFYILTDFVCLNIELSLKNLTYIVALIDGFHYLM